MLTRRQSLTLITASPVLVAITPNAFAEKSPEIYTEDGIAIDGSDAVAYFLEEGPVAGSPEFSYEWKDAIWQFANAENLEAFKSDPEAYAPQYGGYCAFAAARNYIAPTHPNAWTIHDGKLYLNYSRSVRRRWERDIPGNIERGDANWPEVLG